MLVGVRDLVAARRAYQHLGFTVSPRGRHIGWGTANYCVMFPDSYIELLGIVDPAQFTNNLDRFLKIRQGLLGVAFACDDASAAARALEDRGIDSAPPQDLKRKLELPEGEAEPAFKLVHLPRATTPGMPAFICQHLTRELVWQQPWLDHGNGARGIHSVTRVVDDPGAVALAYGRLFGADAVWADRGQVTVETGRGRLRFTMAEGLNELYPCLPEAPAHAVPWLAGLRLVVADVNATAGYLDAAGVRYLRDGDTMLRLDPEYGCGVAVEFAAG